MKILSTLSNLHNWLADMDFIWWPFSFLRPAPKDPMTFKDTLLMSLSFGGLTFAMFTVLAIMNNAFTLNGTLYTFLSCFIGFFLWFNLITRPLWNHRSRSLKGS